MKKREWNGYTLREVVRRDGTTGWEAEAKCRSGCCDRMIVRGTVAATIKHLRANYPLAVAAAASSQDRP